MSRPSWGRVRLPHQQSESVSNSCSHSLPLVTGRDGDLLLKVRATPGAKRDAVVGVHGDALKVAVQAPPEKGKANAAVVDCLARWLGLRRSDVSVGGGGASREKRIRIGSLTREELIRRIRENLPDV